MKQHRTSSIRRLSAALIVAISVVLLFSGCASKSNSQEATPSAPTIKQESFFIFDTIVTVKIYDSRATDQDFKNIKGLMETIDKQMSRTREGSELYNLNQHAGQGPFKVSDEVFGIIETALDYAEKTHGRFEPTIGPLVDLWNIGNEKARVPSQAEIDEKLKLVGYDMVKLDKDNLTVELEKPGMVVDLGSIAKGYAADVIANYVTEQGYKSAIIDLGGNIFAVGDKPGGLDWTVGIQDPDETRGNQIGQAKVKNKTIVTSGVYERYFVKNGKHYHHILDPKTGYPVENNLNSVSIVTDKSTDADALSTSLFSLGLEDGLKFIETKPEAEAIFITTDHKVYTSSGVRKYFELTNDQYKFVE
ncbi:FAD:protein FMN transferase [Paenibacillus sp. 1001270B_150601_E10]|uniref:FAD:protein FMN transferase n=1 Tax=Paenibacillus sp. 1001270B_150601_E10 TaxID=2787079 RepID=UPI0018A0BEF2|nr:FAD:protein FMN transferase [Paenibacillus sp. 1001270B_150601_E10]